MRRAKRNTYIYSLKDGNTIVYIGKTADLKRREQEHKREGKRFTRMDKEFPCSEKVADKREQEYLRAYRRRHKGKNPKYNN